jgi:hypothetical protein
VSAQALGDFALVVALELRIVACDSPMDCSARDIWDIVSLIRPSISACSRSSTRKRARV